MADMEERVAPDGVRLACQAMRCRFELLLFGDSPSRLHAVGEEILSEIRALERQLNFYSSQSELSHVNRLAGHRPVRVEPRLFQLLRRCREIWEETGGAFDPTLSPILEIWGWLRREGRIPTREERAKAKERVGMDRVELDPEARTVRFTHTGVCLNLGSIGKGYALDRARDLLEEYGIHRALIHGGTSSVCALGTDPDGRAWTIGLSNPRRPGELLARAQLRDACLGVSGNNLNVLTADGRRFGHVIDPRTAEPVMENVLAAVITDSAACADAYSTALLCRGTAGSVWVHSTRAALLVHRQGTEILGTEPAFLASSPEN